MKVERGFAMADTLIAMIIVSLFATSLFVANSVMVRSVTNANARLDAILLARTVANAGMETASGEQVISGRTYRWTRSASDLAREGQRFEPSPLKQFDVVVEWEGFRVPQTVTLSVSRLERPDA